MGGRLSHAETPETAPAMARYVARLLSHAGDCRCRLPIRAAERAGAAPAAAVAGGAQLRGPSFADRVETMLTQDGELRPISGIANKLPEHAARIAAVLALVRDIDAGEIAAAEMAAGIELAQHYAGEALRLHGGSRISAELRRRSRRSTGCCSSWAEPAISLPELYQRGPAAIRDSKTARQVVTILEDHGWLVRSRRVPRSPASAGARLGASCGVISMPAFRFFDPWASAR